MTQRDQGNEEVTIRPANGDDAAIITRIYVDSWNAGFRDLMPHRQVDADLVARWQRDLVAPHPRRWWVAEAAGKIVGFAGIGPSCDPVDPRLGELDTIAVDPSMWRRGVGRALLATACQALVAEGYRDAILWTLARYPQGQRFYEAMGWKLDGATRDEGRQVCYHRSLGSAQEGGQHAST